MTGNRLAKHQAPPLESPNVSLIVTAKLNSATLLPQVEQEVTHSCVPIIDQVYSSRADLKDYQAIDNPNKESYTTGAVSWEKGKEELDMQ